MADTEKRMLELARRFVERENRYCAAYLEIPECDKTADQFARFALLVLEEALNWEAEPVKCIYCEAPMPHATSAVCTAMLQCFKAPEGGHVYQFITDGVRHPTPEEVMAAVEKRLSLGRIGG